MEDGKWRRDGVREEIDMIAGEFLRRSRRRLGVEGLGAFEEWFCMGGVYGQLFCQMSLVDKEADLLGALNSDCPTRTKRRKIDSF